MQPAGRPGPRSASSPTTSASRTDAADAFNAGVPHPELSAEPVRRRRAVGVVHPGLRGAASRAASGARPTAWPAPSASLLALVVAVHRARRRPGDAAAHRPRSRRASRATQRELTIALVRDPVSRRRLLVLSAWCLGVLNSHHRFLLSYAAPVMWNAAMIATLVLFGSGTPLPRLAALLAWGVGRRQRAAVRRSGAGRPAGRARSAASRSTSASEHVAHRRAQFRAGVLQPRRRAGERLHRHAARQPAADRRGRRPDRTRTLLYTLPVSLFGMSVSAAELPAMSGIARRDRGRRSTQLRRRLDAGLRRIAFFVVPSAIAFLALGDVVAGGAAADRPLQPRATRCTSGGFLRDRRSGCWPRRSAGLYSSTLLRAARHADAAAATRSCASR